MNLLDSLLGMGQSMLLIAGVVLIIKICYWISLWKIIGSIEDTNLEFAKKQLKQNEEIIENQKEIIRLLGGKVEEAEAVEEEPEEVDKLKYL